MKDELKELWRFVAVFRMTSHVYEEKYRDGWDAKGEAILSEIDRMIAEREKRGVCDGCGESYAMNRNGKPGANLCESCVNEVEP